MIVLEMKVYIYCKTLLNCTYELKKNAFKNQNSRTTFLVGQGGKRKTIKVIKVLLLNFTPVTGITKGIVITDVYQTDMETISDLRDQWIRNILNKLEAEQGKLMKVPSDCFKYEACQTSKMFDKTLHLRV